MHAVLTNQIADFLHFKDNSEYIIFIFLISPTWLWDYHVGHCCIEKNIKFSFLLSQMITMITDNQIYLDSKAK